MSKVYICLEMGGTYLRLGIVDAQFSVVYFEKHPTKLLADAEDKLECLQALLRPLMERAGGIDRIAAVSLALASLMDKSRRVVYSSPMVRGFNNLPLAEGMEQRLGVPVFLEKDVNLLLLYEIHRQHLPQEGIVAGVFIGTGLGNAMCIDGKVYRGYSGSACELGHIPVPEFEKTCGCGKPGCIELMASGNALHQLARELGCSIDQLFLSYGNHPRVKKVLYYLGISIATEVTILDPTMVLLGGGVVNMPRFPLEGLHDIVRANVRIPYPREMLRFAKALGGAEAGIIGAALHARQVLEG